MPRTALAEVGVVRDDHPHRLSGGQRQRAMIAMALAPGPAVLLADEPTASLDPTLRVMVLDLIARLRGDRGLAVLLISHDLGSVARIADRVLVMREGRIVEGRPAAASRRRARSRAVSRRLAPDGVVRRAAARGARGGARVPRTARAGGARPGRREPRRAPGGGGRPGGGVRQRQEHPRPRAGAARRPRRGQRDRRRRGRDGGAGRGPGAVAGDGPDRVPGPLHQPRPQALRGRERGGAAPGAGRARPRRDPREGRGSCSRRSAWSPTWPSAVRPSSPAASASGSRSRGRSPSSPGCWCSTSRCRRSTPPSAAQITDLLGELRAARGLAYLLISHDLGAVRGLAQRVAVMEGGRIVEQGPTAALFRAPRHPHTRRSARRRSGRRAGAVILVGRHDPGVGLGEAEQRRRVGRQPHLGVDARSATSCASARPCQRPRRSRRAPLRSRPRRRCS